MAKNEYTSPSADEFLQLIQAHSPQKPQIASTYDELARIADNVVHANLGESGQEDTTVKQVVEEDDIP